MANIHEGFFFKFYLIIHWNGFIYANKDKTSLCLGPVGYYNKTVTNKLPMEIIEQTNWYWKKKTTTIQQIMVKDSYYLSLPAGVQM